MMRSKPKLKILWIGRQLPVDAQILWLNDRLDKYFEVTHKHLTITFKLAGEIIDTVNKENPDILIPIIPLSYKRFLVNHKNKFRNPNLVILEPIMDSVDGNQEKFNPRTDFYIGDPSKKRILRFRKFKVLKDIKIVTEEFSVNEILKRKEVEYGIN